MQSDVRSTGAGFPATRHSVLHRLQSGLDSERSEAFEILASIYWRPVYAYLRLHHRFAPADAEDIAQGFLGEAWAGDYFSRYEPERARFRTFLRVCLDRFVANHRKAERALKRGGGAPVLSLDFTTAEAAIGVSAEAGHVDQDELFHREFVRSVFASAVELLRRDLDGRGRATAFELFDRYDLGAADGTSYASLAAEFGLTVTAVTNQLHAARRRFREIVLDRLRELAGSDDEFRADAKQILGISIE